MDHTVALFVVYFLRNLYIVFLVATVIYMLTRNVQGLLDLHILDASCSSRQEAIPEDSCSRAQSAVSHKWLSKEEMWVSHSVSTFLDCSPLFISEVPLNFHKQNWLSCLDRAGLLLRV